MDKLDPKDIPSDMKAYHAWLTEMQQWAFANSGWTRPKIREQFWRHGVDDLIRRLRWGPYSEEAKQLRMKKAYVVTFSVATRVVIPVEELGNEEYITKRALENIQDSLSDYICIDNIERIDPDDSQPYNPERDGE